VLGLPLFRAARPLVDRSHSPVRNLLRRLLLDRRRILIHRFSKGTQAMNDLSVTPITVGSRWRQPLTPGPRGRKRIREIEVISAPTLSNPVGYRIIRNDIHPHRRGKIASIRVADLRLKYEAVTA
jgi:hypothetical protein